MVDTLNKEVQHRLELLQQGLDLHLQELRKSMAHLEEEISNKKALLSLLPKTLPLAPAGVRLTVEAYKADAELTFDIKSREQIMQLLEVFPGVPVVRVKNGVSAFVAEERFTSNDAHSDIVTPIGEMVYRVSSWIKGLREEYFWWTKLGNKLVRISAINETNPQTCISAESQKEFQSDATKTTWRYTNLPKGLVSYWYGGNTSSCTPITVHVPRGDSLVDALIGTMTAVSVVRSYCNC